MRSQHAVVANLGARALACAFVSALGLNSAPLHAADGAGNYAIWGSGGRSCHQYTRSADDQNARQAFRDYLMGYLTAYNAVADDTYNALGGMNLEAALAWLDDYCTTNKMDSYDRAITALVIARHSERARAPGGQAATSWGRAPAPADSNEEPPAP